MAGVEFSGRTVVADYALISGEYDEAFDKYFEMAQANPYAFYRLMNFLLRQAVQAKAPQAYPFYVFHRQAFSYRREIYPYGFHQRMCGR